MRCSARRFARMAVGALAAVGIVLWCGHAFAGVAQAQTAYDTAAAADDIDAVRAALGFEKLDLWGDSYGTFLLPAAVDAARHHDLALLKRMTALFRIGEAARFFGDPAVSSIAVAVAVECHDYPRPYSVADPVARRRAEYARGLASLNPGQFRP